MKKFIAAISIACYCTLSLGHGGGLDSSGCHNENSTGTRHCHKKDSNSSNASVGAGAALVAMVLVYGIYFLNDRKKTINQFGLDEMPDSNLTMLPYVQSNGFGASISYKF
jgi:hypothetical protein